MSSSGASAFALPCASGDGSRVVVVLHHALDEGVAGALDVLEQLSQVAQLRPLVCVAYQAPPGDEPTPLSLGRSTRLLNGGSWESAGLMYTLHHLGELQRIDVVAVCTGGLDADSQAELAGACVQLQGDLSRVAPANTSVQSHRVWIPDYGDHRLVPPADFLQGPSAGVYVVLPIDRQHDRAVAMPVSAHEGDAHRWHVATELASLAGLWSTMVGSPLEQMRPATGGAGRPLACLVQSTCRAARILIPSPAQTLAAEGLLPLPPAHLPAPDPARVAEAVAPYAFPEAFRLVESEADPAAGTGESDADAWHLERSELMPHVMPIRQTLLAAETVGTVLDRRDDVAAARRRLDDFALTVARTVPWTATLIDPAGELRSAGRGPKPRPTSAPTAEEAEEPAAQSPPAASDSEDSDEPPERRDVRAMAHARERLMSDLPPVSLEAVPTDSWDDVVGSCLGVADAASLAVEARAQAHAERFVTLDRHAIAPEPRTDAAGLSDVVARIVEEARSARAGRYRKIGVSGGALADALDTDVRSAGHDTTAVGMPQDTGATEHGRPSLVVAVTREFDDEIDGCDAHVDRRVRDLHRRLDPEQRPEPGVTSFVGYALLASLLIVAGALLTLTGLREVLSPDRLSDELRVMLFGLVSLLAALPPMLRLTPSRSLSAQVRLTLIAGGYGASAAAVAVLAGPLSRSALDRPGRWWPAIGLVLAVMGLATAARVRKFTGVRDLLGPLVPLVSDRVAGAVPLLYAFVIAVCALNYDASAPEVFEQRSWRLLTVLLAGAVTVAIVTAGMVRIIRGRDRRRVREWRDGIAEGVERCELAAARVQAMRMLRRHWLITAAVIARLVHRPFGSSALHSPAADPPSGTRKLMMLDVELTDDAREAFLAELNPELAAPGWLNGRYRSISDRFVERQEARFGVGESVGLPPPEHCTYPLRAVPPRAEGAGGYRWLFAEQFYRGDFDEMLGRVTEDAMSAALRTTFMSEQSGVPVEVSEVEDASLASLFSELLPSGGARLPSGLLPPRADEAPEYTPYVWWPADLPVPATAESPQHRCETARLGGMVLLHAVRVDVSEPLDLDRLVPIAEATDQTAADQVGTDRTEVSQPVPEAASPTRRTPLM